MLIAPTQTQRRDGLDDLLQRTVGRWSICPLWSLRGKMFTFAEKALIIALLDVWHTANRASWFWVTRAKLAQLMGGSQETLRIARRGLVKKCIIEVKRGRQHEASQYHFSQDFLYNLTKAKELSPLKTSTYSDSKESSGLDSVEARQSARF